MPGSWILAQNYPNPFNPSTTITFGLPERSRVRLSVYNTLGEMVSALTDAEWDPGYHSVAFNATGLPSGVYFYKVDAGPFVMTRRLMLLR
ncbi:MAG: T9SS type A sorting domain-containing protein [Ignavibacteriae bacterium]|nr:T9SS type A sorting domain-containing protein [Ignavibacteriota bacterium]